MQVENNVSKLVEILNNDWNLSFKPIIDVIYNHKELIGAKDWVLLYQTSDDYDVIDLGYNNYANTQLISIDIRTTNEGKLYDIQNEILRILFLYRKSQLGWDIMELERINNLSNRSIGLFRAVLDVKLIKYVKEV